METLMSDLDEFRKEKDEFFGRHPQSPLAPDQKSNFTGLNYFSENENLRLDVTAELLNDPQPLQMQTTTGGVQVYMRHGRFKFDVDGHEAELTIYKGEHGYFLPFVDSLAGEETYPAGRYLEPDELPGNHFIVDFKIAYNPYCAYNEMWSCPITPAENRLKVPIRAGEKIFK
jgi:uncharacterized protein (DUF1684 family)